MSIKESSRDSFVTNDLVVTAASGKGIKVGDWTDRGGEVAQFGWRDITGQVTVRGIGGASPTWAQVGSGPFRAYQFAVNDECWFSYHIPHDIVPSADVHFHAHWVADGTDINPVKWQFTYAYALGFDQEAFDLGTGTTVTAEGTPSGTQYQHNVTETAAVSIPTLTEPDGLIYMHIKRITNGATDNTDAIFMLTADIHYQSTNIGTIGKAPGFYG